MQLREYFAILRRFWPVVVLLPLLAGGLSLALALGRQPAYAASARLMVTFAPPAEAGASPVPALDENSAWLITEYILDDLPIVLSSSAFAADVGAAMAAEGHPADAAAIQSGLRAEVTHRSVVISATAASPEQAGAMLRGALAALERGGLGYWGRAPSGDLRVAVLDPPGPAAPAGGLRALAREVGLRVALALAAGVGLAFLVHYLDDRLRSPRQAEDWVGARVLAVIPKDQ